MQPVDNFTKPFRNRGRTPSERAEYARMTRPEPVFQSSLARAVQEGIADFWRDLSAPSSRGDSNSEDFGDVIAKMLLNLYLPEQLLFDATDERLFQSEDLRWRQPLSGGEDVVYLIRLFASAAGLRLDQVEHGFRGNRNNIYQEFFRYAERYRNQPDLIVALLKGVLVRTLSEKNGPGHSIALGTNVVSGVLTHAWQLVEVQSQSARQFLTELAQFVQSGLSTNDWQEMIDVAHRVVELMEQLEDETDEIAGALTRLWHELLRVLCNHANDVREMSRIWLRWYSWVAQGYASQLQRIADSSVPDKTNSRLTLIVDRLAEHAVVAAMRSVPRHPGKVISRSMVETLCEDFDTDKIAMDWMYTVRDYHQFFESILLVSPCWEARFAWPRTADEYIHGLFHCGLAATVALAVEDSIDDQVERWIHVANVIQSFRRNGRDVIESRHDILIKVEEVFVHWLALGIALNGNAFKWVLPCLQRIWGLFDSLLTSRPGYDSSRPPFGLTSLSEQTTIWLDRYCSDGAQFKQEVDELKELMQGVAGNQELATSRTTSLPDEFSKAFDRLTDVLGAERDASQLTCPLIARNEGDATNIFAPAIAIYWRAIFTNLSSHIDGAPQWPQLIKPILGSLAYLHEAANDTKLLDLTQIFDTTESTEELVSQTPSLDKGQIESWKVGPLPWLVQQWGSGGAAGDRKISEWLSSTDFAFLQQPHGIKRQ